MSTLQRAALNILKNILQNETLSLNNLKNMGEKH